VVVTAPVVPLPLVVVAVPLTPPVVVPPLVLLEVDELLLEDAPELVHEPVETVPLTIGRLVVLPTPWPVVLPAPEVVLPPSVLCPLQAEMRNAAPPPSTQARVVIGAGGYSSLEERYKRVDRYFDNASGHLVRYCSYTQRPVSELQ
jgi:hypothetical protein